MLAAAVEVMASCGAQRERLVAALGPCISASGYQVGEDVAAALRDRGLGACVQPDGTGRYHADLAAAVARQLLAQGLTAGSVAPPRAWTDGGTTYFSDRAQRPCGRFALVARLARHDS